MKVLLATDGSEESKDAEWLFERLPFSEPLELMLVCVVEIPALKSLQQQLSMSEAEILDAFYSRAESQVASEASRFEGMDGTIKSCVRAGNPADEILQIAQETGSELIVLGARRSTLAQRFFMGSTSLNVARHAHCSVLVTRSSDSMKQSSRAFRILVAHDGSEASRHAVQMLAGLSLGEHVEILVVNVMPTQKHFAEWDVELGTALREQEKNRRQTEVNWAIQQLAKATQRVAGEVLVGDSVAEELVDLIERLGVDLVLMGHRGMGPVQKFLLGSTSDKVLRYANCSVWIDRAQP